MICLRLPARTTAALRAGRIFDTLPSSLAYPGEEALLCATVAVLNWRGYQAEIRPAVPPSVTC